MLLGDVGYRMYEGCLGGCEGLSETGRTTGLRSSQKTRSLLSSKAAKFEFFDA